MSDREGQRIHRQLTEATATWQDHQRDPGTLLRGTRLAVVSDWARHHPDIANQAETAFLDASMTANTEERAAIRRRAWVLRGFVALLCMLVVVTTITAIQAVRAEQTATQQRNAAVALNAVSTAADLASTNPTLAAKISLAAYRLHPSNQPDRAFSVGDCPAATCDRGEDDDGGKWSAHRQHKAWHGRHGASRHLRATCHARGHCAWWRIRGAVQS
jgi:hypothetical protein